MMTEKEFEVFYTAIKRGCSPTMCGCGISRDMFKKASIAVIDTLDKRNIRDTVKYIEQLTTRIMPDGWE